MFFWRMLYRKGNPMFWPQVDRALLACTMVCFMYLFFLGSGLFAAALPDLTSHINRAALTQVNIFTFSQVLLWSLLLALFWLVRQQQSNSALPATIVIYLFGQPLMILAYFNGVHTIVTGLMLAVSPAFGFVLFQSRHVTYSMLIVWVEVIVLAVAVVLGWLPDGPLFGDSPPNRFLQPMWLLTQVVLSFPVGMGFLLVTQGIVEGLRRREQQVIELSRRDPLTGIWNRGYFDELLRQEIARAERGNALLSLVVVDLDHFKQINDQHGHLGGDQALIAVTRVLASSIREVDHLGRFGGEEFLLLLPGADSNTAARIAERCRATLAATPIELPSTTLRVTASFGVATAHPPVHPDPLFRLADQALYRAKAAGRNRVEVAPPG